MDTPKDIRDLLEQLPAVMAERRDTEVEAAQFIGVSQSTINRWRRTPPDTMHPNNIRRLAEYVGQRPLRHYPGTIPATKDLTTFILDRIPESMSLRALAKMISYDNVASLRQLLSGNLDWFPSILSALCVALDIDFADLPIADHHRALLHQAYAHGGHTRLAPVVGLAHATGIRMADGIATLPSTFWESDELAPVPCDGRRYVIIRNDGDSMAPGILDGDLLRCDPQAPIGNNHVVVACFDHSTVCKRYHALPHGQILLTSDNTASGETFSLTEETFHHPDNWIIRVVALDRPVL